MRVPLGRQLLLLSLPNRHRPPSNFPGRLGDYLDKVGSWYSIVARTKHRSNRMIVGSLPTTGWRSRLQYSTTGAVVLPLSGWTDATTSLVHGLVYYCASQGVFSLPGVGNIVLDTTEVPPSGIVRSSSRAARNGNGRDFV